MADYPYHVVDVFTAEPLTGNPLAVVFHPGTLTDAQMLAIAREFNLSETTFVERRAAEVEAAEGVRVRIYTTDEELPFAGHPTLGTAAVLRSIAPEVVADDAGQPTVRLALNIGTVPVRFRSESFGEMRQRNPELGPQLDRSKVAELLGLALDDLDPELEPQIVSTGTAFGVVVLRSLEALSRLSVRQQEATVWLRAQGARWFYVLARTGAEAPAWRARMQFNGGEDPATGSAAGCAISYLVATQAVEPEQAIHLRQGVEIGRSSDLYLTASVSGGVVENVRVAGSTKPVAMGCLFLP